MSNTNYENWFEEIRTCNMPLVMLAHHITPYRKINLPLLHLVRLILPIKGTVINPELAKKVNSCELTLYKPQLTYTMGRSLEKNKF